MDADQRTGVLERGLPMGNMNTTATRRYRKSIGFGARLTEAMRSRGLSSAEASRQLKIRSPSVVEKWCRGEAEPRLDSFVRICEALEVSADWLLFGRGER